jgi:hypothetical protein
VLHIQTLNLETVTDSHDMACRMSYVQLVCLTWLCSTVLLMPVTVSWSLQGLLCCAVVWVTGLGLLLAWAAVVPMAPWLTASMCCCKASSGSFKKHIPGAQDPPMSGICAHIRAPWTLASWCLLHTTLHVNVVDSFNTITLSHMMSLSTALQQFALGCIDRCQLKPDDTSQTGSNG